MDGIAFNLVMNSTLCASKLSAADSAVMVFTGPAFHRQVTAAECHQFIGGLHGYIVLDILLIESYVYVNLVNNSYLGGISKNFANGHSLLCVTFPKKYVCNICIVRQSFTCPV